MRFLLAAILLATPCLAQVRTEPKAKTVAMLPVRGVVRGEKFVSDHPVMAVADAAMLAAGAWDWVTTYHAERVCALCVDQGLGRNPPTWKIGLWTMMGPAGVIAFNAAASHHYGVNGPEPDSAARFFFEAGFSTLVTIHGISDAKDNNNAINWLKPTQAAQQAQRARDRVSGRE